MVLFTFCKTRKSKQQEVSRQLKAIQTQRSDFEKERLLWNNNHHADTVVNIPYEESFKDSKILDNQLQ